MFIPESKRLDVLLREFRVSRNRMAIVVNRYGGMAGLVTIEDVLEQIVGNIEDEYDLDQSHDNIRRDAGELLWSGQHQHRRFSTPPSAAIFLLTNSTPSAASCSANWAIVAKEHEIISLAGIRFQVLRADSRRLYTLLVDLLPPAEQAGD